MDALIEKDSTACRGADGLVEENARDFRVSTRVYTDAALFDLELERIFGTTWLYVAHESEIPEGGSFKTAFIGRQPVIVSRDESGSIHVLFNRCRHRGSVVCREERGRADYFQCPYHGWVYAHDGRLTGIAQRASGYPDDFARERLGLLAVPRVDSYRGLIFASLQPQGASLIEHLGAAKTYIDYQFDRSPDGRIALPYPPHRTIYEGNWKFQVENATDAYHVNYVHESFQLLLEEFASESGQHGNHPGSAQNRDYWDRLGATYGFGGGHGLLEARASPEFLDELQKGPQKDYLDALVSRHGAEAAHAAMGQYHLVLYPNLAILHGQLRVIRPITVDRTEVLTYPYALEGIRPAQEAERLRGYERFFGPAGFGQPDDMAIFGLNQLGLQASAVEWLVLSRGMHTEISTVDGVRVGSGTSETPIRAAFRAWRALMAPD